MFSLFQKTLKVLILKFCAFSKEANTYYSLSSTMQVP